MRRDHIIKWQSLAGFSIGMLLGLVCIWIGWQLALIAHADAIHGVEHRWDRALERVSVEALDTLRRWVVIKPEARAA